MRQSYASHPYCMSNTHEPIIAVCTVTILQGVQSSFWSFRARIMLCIASHTLWWVQLLFFLTDKWGFAIHICHNRQYLQTVTNSLFCGLTVITPWGPVVVTYETSQGSVAVCLNCNPSLAVVYRKIRPILLYFSDMQINNNWLLELWKDGRRGILLTC